MHAEFDKVCSLEMYHSNLPGIFRKTMAIQRFPSKMCAVIINEMAHEHQPLGSNILSPTCPLSLSFSRLMQVCMLHASWCSRTSSASKTPTMLPLLVTAMTGAPPMARSWSSICGRMSCKICRAWRTVVSDDMASIW